ncbi:helix-turn-helix domain-containing protein [Prescottella equi]|uniref:AlbA family DNA-binding domain-containing protein n=1 Tax=Rhodococcus hoagii TaxID=43767 RepID=UPI00111C730A|nr:ATP-binding protein [Prescottella equi]
MTHSFYLGPKKARFTPSSWDDIVTAAGDGLLDEGHWVELKKDLPPKGAGANLELARDLASLSIDGGSFIIGIEDNKGQAGEVTGARLEGLASRLDATAQARIQPPLTITTATFENPVDPDLAVLIVTVPASSGAPHMVDGSYWGRGDEGKRTLADSEVRRLLDVRRERDAGFDSRLCSVMDAVGVEAHEQSHPYVYLLAEPVGTPNGEGVSGVLSRTHPLEFFVDAAGRRKLQWYPTLQSLNHRIPHPDGFAARSWDQDKSDVDYDRLAVLVGDDGSWRACSGGAISPIGSSADYRSGPLVVRGGSIIELTHSILSAIAYLSTSQVPLNCEWRIGVLVTNLRGIYPVEQHLRELWHDFSPYPRSEYLKVVSATTSDLADTPSHVVEQLLLPLFRSLSIDSRYFPYEGIENIGRKRR